MSRDEQDDAGEVFGPYRLRALLGRGGMGEVWLAHHTGLDREVALKRISGQPSQDPELKTRFRREARLAARLSSAHVVPIHEFGEIDGRLYLDMRYVRGPDLRSVLDVNPYGLHPAAACDVVTQLADALDAAHEQELVHRDVKPSNVLVDQARGRWFCYLADFGVAVPARGFDTRITSTGLTIGTPAYMAPELLAENGSPGVASDLYALGCLLFELLTGRTPYPGANHAAVLYQHMNAEPPRPSAYRPDLAPFDAVVHTALAKDPAQRFASAGALARALPRIETSLPPVPGPGAVPATAVGGWTPPPGTGPFPSGAGRPGTGPSAVATQTPPPTALGSTPPPWQVPPWPQALRPQTPPPPRRRRRWRVLVPALVLALLLAAGGAYAGVRLLGRDEPPPPPPVPTAVSAVRLALTFDDAYGVAVPPAGRHVYVVANENGVTTLVVLDATTNQVTRRIGLDSRAVGLTVSPDETRAYVTAPGSDRDPGDFVQAVDLTQGRVTANIPVGRRVAYPTFSPDGRRLYLTRDGENKGPGAFVTIDVATGKVAGTVPLTTAPGQVAISPDGRTAYVATGTGDGGVAVVDTASQKVARTLPTRANPLPLALTPDGRTLYVGTADDAGSTLDVIDTASSTANRVSPPGVDIPPLFALTPDGGRLVVPSIGADEKPARTVSFLDPTGLPVAAAAALSGRPVFVAPTPDGHHAYVTTFDPGAVWFVAFP